MKKLLTLFTFLATYNSFSQTDILPVDESGHYTFYEVVELNNFDKESLMKNGESFLKYYINKKYRKEIEKNWEEGQLKAQSSFLVYKKGSLGKNVDGAVEYSITIEVKDNKYRYVLTDFVFQEYERNRYGKFQPVKGKVTALEQPSSNLNEWQWDEHKRTVKEKMEEFATELKLVMVTKEQEKVEKVKVKENW